MCFSPRPGNIFGTAIETVVAGDVLIYIQYFKTVYLSYIFLEVGLSFSDAGLLLKTLFHKFEL